MNTFDITFLSELLTACCVVFGGVQLWLAFWVYDRVPRTANRQAAAEERPDSELPPLSVILVTKDSAQALQTNLPRILEQDYPSFEVIVINDQSSDADGDVLKRLSASYPHLYYSFIPTTARYVSRKKLGVAMGIRASRHEWLVFTDPHCCPHSDRWLRSLAQHFTAGTDIVLGYSGFEGKGGYFGYKVRIQNFFTSLRYLGWAAAGHPYMGIGRNLAYRKSTYERHKGFTDHLPLQQGDDDLLVNAMANGLNTRIAVSPDSWVRLPLPPYKRLWVEERVGRKVTGRYYQGGVGYWNAVDTGSSVLFGLCTLAGLAISIWQQLWICTAVIAAVWVIRFVCAMTVWRRASKALGERLCCAFPLFEWLRPWWSLQTQLQYVFRHKQDFLRK